jgi:hypothetical protein
LGPFVIIIWLKGAKQQRRAFCHGSRRIFNLDQRDAFAIVAASENGASSLYSFSGFKAVFFPDPGSASLHMTSDD